MERTGIIVISITVAIHLFVAACTYVEKIRDGKQAFQYEQYSEAIPLLKKEYSKSKTRLERGKIAYLLAESHQRNNQPSEAIDWYKIAYDNQYGSDALKKYAFALKQSERYEEAIQSFQELGIEIGSPYEYRREIKSCESALTWKKEKNPRYEVESLSLNSRWSDYAPSLFKDQLVFTSDRGTATGEESYKRTGNAFSDIFIADLSSNRVDAFAPNLNTPSNEGSAVFNSNYSEVYFSRCTGGKRGDIYCQLVSSTWDGNGWSAPQPLPFLKEGVNYGHSTITKDGKTLYFECNDPDGWGGIDIWMVERTVEGWSTPQLLGRSINTEGNERFPFIDSDTLYFSSDYHEGMGGLDIFKSYKLNGKWTPAQNLKTPINSGGDDFGYIIDYATVQNATEIEYLGYFSSSRNTGEGQDDIYKFVKKIPPPKPIPTDKDSLPPTTTIAAKMYLDIFVLEKIFEAANDPTSRVLGRKPLEGAKLQIAAGKNKPINHTTGVEGLFALLLEENTDYRFLVSKEGYLTTASAFSTKEIARDPNVSEQRFVLEIVLEKIYKDQEIVLENIYYDYDKWDIREDAKPTLDKLAADLKLNPQIRIELGSHTDCRGNNNYNYLLSQRRAQAAVDYLVANTVNGERLVAVGHGENLLRVDCICAQCTEEEHQMNRRTTFKIID